MCQYSIFECFVHISSIVKTYCIKWQVSKFMTHSGLHLGTPCTMNNKTVIDFNDRLLQHYYYFLLEAGHFPSWFYTDMCKSSIASGSICYAVMVLFIIITLYHHTYVGQIEFKSTTFIFFWLPTLVFFFSFSGKKQLSTIINVS